MVWAGKLSAEVPLLTVNVTSWPGLVPSALEAVTVKFVSTAVGVPEMRPESVFTERPEASPVALKAVGALVPEIW